MWFIMVRWCSKMANHGEILVHGAHVMLSNGQKSLTQPVQSSLKINWITWPAPTPTIHSSGLFDRMVVQPGQ